MTRILADYLAIWWDSVRILVFGSFGQKLARFQVMVLATAVLPVLLLVHATLLLDHLLYPGFKDVEIKQPLFIVGNLRTGSTFLHKLLGSNTDEICTFRTLDLFLQSIVLKKLAAVLGRLDARVGGHGKRLMVAFDDRVFQDFRKIHDVRLFDPEEDDFALLGLLKSAALYEAFPDVARYKRLMFADTLMEPDEKAELVRYYRAIVQRHLYHCGPEKLFIAKNPLFAHKVELLTEAFPDARVVNLVRHPYKTVPSCASMWHFVWWRTGAYPANHTRPEECIALCKAFYDHPRRTIEALGDNGTDLRFEVLIKNPQEAIRTLFQRFGYEYTPAMDALVVAEMTRERPFKSKHRYTGEHFGISDAMLDEHFAAQISAHTAESGGSMPALPPPGADSQDSQPRAS